ncbi:methionine/alanine import family NSS transporter small subunit [Psychrobacter lutiphocae]|uniref:methionine/alanine import family NSS transporter small subunit n=1 Tax=Psychrobacter lutiphocae TaxID=540500 RepID=UPI00035D5067|nr:methionine/alanine import family NSS transporter small subunit [Psychrobacter lutiphocae]
MSSSAIALMIFAMLAIWGGLILAIIHLIRHPDVPMDDVSGEYVQGDEPTH